MRVGLRFLGAVAYVIAEGLTVHHFLLVQHENADDNQGMTLEVKQPGLAEDTVPSSSAGAAAANAPEKRRPRRVWISILVSMLVLAGAYAVKGWLMASIVEGTYSIKVMVVDCLVLALVILALRLLDLGVKNLTCRWIGNQTKTKRVLATTAHLSVVFLIAAPFLIALIQFHPQKIGCGTTPGELGLRYSNVELESDGRQLAAWHLPASSAERPVVVVCHGLGANKQNFLPMAFQVHELDYNVLIFDFRGHGDSDGRTITFGCKESNDVKAALDYARMMHPSSKVYGLGYSMGGSALLKLAAEQGGFHKLVLDCTFARAEHVANSMLWFFGPAKTPVWHLGRMWGWVFAGVDVGRHNPEEYIARVQCPILLIHGAADDVIPATESIHLHEASGKRAELWIVEGQGHLGAMNHPAYGQRLRKFFEGE